uniref:Tail fibers protein n=1 Tax=Lactococcus phage CHPC1182 TaxID=2675242 RepID=A0A650ERN4_9CAUD
MAYTSKNELTHGLGYGVVFTDLTGSKAGIPIAGLRAVEAETNQDNKNFYAGFNAPYRTIAGAKNTQIKVKSYDLPDEFAIHALGFGIFNMFIVDDTTNYKPYGFAYAERYRDDDGTGYKATFYPSVQATTPSDTAEADEESPTGKEYEHTATVTTGDFTVGNKKRLFIKFKVSDRDLATGTIGRALAFKKLFNELKPLTSTDIKE